jgi:uncharacterized membrane protein YhaH (DUF805 family)
VGGFAVSWTSFLFSFKGRFNRAKYWLFILIYAMTAVTVTGIGAGLMLQGAAEGGIVGLAAGGTFFFVLLFLFVIVAFISSLAVSVKRLHDRNKSGWWVLIFFVLPFVLAGTAEAMNPSELEVSTAGIIFSLLAIVMWIWGFIELAVLRGTVGENRYGPDPVPRPAETAATFN